MSATSVKSKIILRLLLYAFLTLLAWSLLHTYLAVRTERVRTRLSMLMAAREHGVVCALPAGRYQIQFTPKPNVGPGIIVPAHPILPAHISTSLVRQNGELIKASTTDEYVVFTIEGSDAFRPQRLLVSITKTQDCLIYMNLGPGF